MSGPQKRKVTIQPEERMLFEAAAGGDQEARSQIILDHLKIVKRYARSYAQRGVPYEDLYQEGCYGLIDALNHYDVFRGVPFATFATYYVLKYIKLALLEQNTYYPGRYNGRLYAEVKKYRAAYGELRTRYGRPPTEVELATHLGRSVTHVRSVKQASGHFLTYSEDIGGPVTEMAASLSVSHSSRPVEDTVLQNIFDLSEYDVRLTKREEDVVCRRLGFTENGTPETWKDISASMGLSINWLQATYGIAMEKLKRAALQH